MRLLWLTVGHAWWPDRRGFDRLKVSSIETLLRLRVQPSYRSSSVLFGFSFSVIRITESLKFAAKKPGVCELWA
jgi:hypothetical protein